MKSIGLISKDRLKNISRKAHAQHEFCFHLHDLMAHLLVQMEIQKAGHIKIEIESAEDQKTLASGIHILDFLEKSGRGDLERRVVMNHMCIALFSDMLHFIYEGLIALEKRKFTVAFSLFRKPFKEGLLMAAQMCANEEDFFNRLKFDAKNLLDKKTFDERTIKLLLEKALAACSGSGFPSAEIIYDTAFNRKNDRGLAGMFDKAIHLATGFSHIRTENYNINFIFKNPEDNDVYEGDTYSQIASLLLFLNIMQIELYSRMRESSKKYQSWMIFTSVGAFEALFTPGRSRMTNFVNRHFSNFLQYPGCEKEIVIRKVDIPRLFIGETIDCDHCYTSHHFPFGWLLNKMDLDLFES